MGRLKVPRDEEDEKSLGVCTIYSSIADEVVKSPQIRCIKVVYEKEGFIKICGRFARKSITIEYYGISYKLDLCEECFEEFKKKEKEEKAKENERFKKTDFKCPECGKPVFKHYHIKHGLYPEYRWFWCPNWHDLYCGNCRHGLDSHGDECTAFFCLNGSGWKPIEKEE